MPSPLEEPLPEEMPQTNQAPQVNPGPPPMQVEKLSTTQNPVSNAQPVQPQSVGQKPMEHFVDMPPRNIEAQSSLEESLQMPSAQKPSKLKWFFVFIVLVGLIFGGYVVYQKGYLHSIFTRFSSGTGSNSIQALQPVSDAMSRLNSFRVEGDITLQLQSTQTSKYQGSWIISGKGEDRNGSFEITTQNLPSNILATYPALKDTSNLKINFILKDNIFYYQIPSLKDNSTATYRKTNFSLINTVSTGVPFLMPDKIDLNYLTQNLQQFQKGQQETIDGIETISYQVDLKDLQTFTFWVGKKDNLVYQLKHSFPWQIASENFQVAMTGKFSKPAQELTITAPNNDEINQGSVSDLFKGKTVATNKPDTQRKTDLKLIKTALNNYQSDYSVYPQSTALIKTSDTNSVLAKALVPKYIEKLPVDPQTPKYYYGYKSDGTTFELSAVLENKDDPEGQKIGDKTILILKSD